MTNLPRTRYLETSVAICRALAIAAIVIAAGCSGPAGEKADLATGEDGGVAFAPGSDGTGGESASQGREDVPDLVPTEIDRPPEAGPVDSAEETEDTEMTTPEVSCIPACEGKECGDDGCGGNCGECPQAAPDCVESLCVVSCSPDCAGKECGDDGCGGNCGECPQAAPDCIDSLCVVSCFPDCVGKECGDDGCGGECGPCPQAAPICSDHICEVECLPDCFGKECGTNGCGGECGTCPDSLPICEGGLCIQDPATIDPCTEEAKQIFLVSESKAFLRFEPLTLNVVTLGSLNCNAAFGETPYSMSVDRNGFAWVLYSDGSLWKVDTEDASCFWTPFQPNQLGFEIFGMGFSTNGGDTLDETLFIAGGDYWDLQFGDATLGSIDLDTLTVSSIAPFSVGSGLPELTGNRSGELWGFFAQKSPPQVARIDKLNAAQFQAIELPAPMFANVQAWAFAFWGGDFYIFFKSDWDPASGVWRLNAATGELTQELPNSGHVITGAGVSTCAPTGDDGG